MRATGVRAIAACLLSVRLGRTGPEFQFRVARLELLSLERLGAALEFQIEPDRGGGLFAADDLRQQPEFRDAFGLRGRADVVAEYSERYAARTRIAYQLRVSDTAAAQPLEQSAFTGFRGRGLEVHPEAIRNRGRDLARQRRITTV